MRRQKQLECAAHRLKVLASMRYSQFGLTTLKEVPAEAEIVSHKLMLRAGLIRRLASGLFTWMPLGLRVLRKVEAIVREEMNHAGALELLMPAVQPSELWEESGRWDEYGPLLLRMHDRHQREFCFGPTHEEVITDIARRELRSYKQLPVNFYQIQTKFRDEIRPRFGVMRAREFIMKDAYSFDIDHAGLEASYGKMHAAYTAIFARLGLRFRVVDADSGEIGGSRSQEFHVLADSGEDVIAYSDADHYASNLETAATVVPEGQRPAATESLEKIATPGIRTIEALCKFLDITPKQTLKTLIVEGTDGPIALALRGDHDLNSVKAQKIPGVASPLTMAGPEVIQKVTGCGPGFAGPVGLDIPVYFDHATATMSDFVCGANEADMHFRGANFDRDIDIAETLDLRNVVAGDPTPGGKGTLNIARGIEVGHIFQLGNKYSRAMGATVQDPDGKNQAMAMGCYGIGITRIVAAAIEQNHDDNGIIWPAPLAPFDLVLVPINMQRSDVLRDAAETLYTELTAQGLEVLFDDRDARPGVKFADAELIGIPHRLVISERNLAAGELEYRHRTDTESRNLKREEALKLVKESAVPC
jgi:prolyl-tRNA synthetase